MTYKGKCFAIKEHDSEVQLEINVRAWVFGSMWQRFFDSQYELSWCMFRIKMLRQSTWLTKKALSIFTRKCICSSQNGTRFLIFEYCIWALHLSFLLSKCKTSGKSGKASERVKRRTTHFWVVKFHSKVSVELNFSLHKEYKFLLNLQLSLLSELFSTKKHLVLRLTPKRVEIHSFTFRY